MALGKVLSKAALKKLKDKLKKKSDKRIKEEGKARRDKAKKEGTEKKPTVSRSFKKDYEVDIGKPNPTDRTIRDMPQRKVRGTSGRAADTGPDPIVVGSKSMPSMIDAASPASKRRAKQLNKAEEIVRKGTASKATIAKAKQTIANIKKIDADSKKAQEGGKRSVTPLEKGEYVDTDTGQVITIDRKISAQTLDTGTGSVVSEAMRKKIVAGLGTRWLRNPTRNELEQQMSGRAYARYLREKGISPEEDSRKAKGKLKKEKIKRIVKTTQDPKYKRLDITKGLTDAEKKKLGLKQGGMAMKKKGYAKGGMKKKKGMARGGAMMKKKGMAMGGLKKPAAGQTGLKKLPTPVRNKMGYMAKGGMKKKGMAMGGMKKKGYAMGGMRVKYKVGGMVKGKSYGMVDKRKKK